MFDYFFLISIPIFFSLITANNSKKSQILLLIVGAFYVLFIGLRDEVGPDWLAYQMKYDYLSESTFLKGLFTTEPGFAALNWIVAKLNGGVHVVNLIIAFILMTGIIRVAKTTAFPWLALISVTPYLIIVIGMSASRQTAAIGIFLHIIASWRQSGTFIKKICLSFSAISFHYSAFIVLVFVLQSIRMATFKRIVVLVLGIIISYPILSATNKFAVYEEIYMVRNIVSSGAIMHVSLNAIPGAIYLFFVRKWNRVLGESDLLLFFSILSILSVFAVSVSSTAIDRLSLYFSPVQMMVYGNLPNLFSNRVTKASLYLFISFIHLIIMILWFNYAGHVESYLHYENIIINGITND